MPNSKDGTRRAILYTRVSTEEQKKQGYSLSSQKRRLENYCESHNIFVVQHFEDDASAKTFERPGFKKLLALSKSQRRDIDLILFVKWDRFSRNLEQAISMHGRISRMGLEANAIDQWLGIEFQFDTSQQYVDVRKLKNLLNDIGAAMFGADAEQPAI